MKTTTQEIIKVRKPKPRFKVIEVIANLFSPRFFSDGKIPKNHINSIFEAARWTPSGRNHQPWFFYLVKKESLFYQKLFSTLNEYNQKWAKSAPVLILGCTLVKNQFGENPFAVYDLGASVMSLILQAQSLGYYGRQIGLFDKEKVREIFKLDESMEPFIIIALGKIGNYKNASEEVIKMDLDPRPRKSEIYKEI